MKCHPVFKRHIPLMLLCLVRSHRLSQRHHEASKISDLSRSRQFYQQLMTIYPGSSLPRIEQQPDGVECAGLCCCVALSCLLLPHGTTSLARVPRFHHYVEACQFVSSHHGRVPDVNVLCRIGKAGAGQQRAVEQFGGRGRLILSRSDGLGVQSFLVLGLQMTWAFVVYRFARAAFELQTLAFLQSCPANIG
jgi:hypothetical protein